MSIFGSILSKIFGHHGAQEPAPVGATAAPPVAPAGATAAAQPDRSDERQPASSSSRSTPVAPAATAAAANETVDVEEVLTELAAKNGQGLNWRQSIVDLLKLLKLDSSLAARKDLAAELHYGGDVDDSAAMNIWLHKQVMQKLADNGGKVPDSLRA